MDIIKENKMMTYMKSDRFLSIVMLTIFVIIFPLIIISCLINRINIFKYLFMSIKYDCINYEKNINILRDEKLKQLGI